MKKSSQNVKIFQWNSRSISTNLLAFENHISQSNYCILALQFLNTEKKKESPKDEKLLLSTTV